MIRPVALGLFLSLAVSADAIAQSGPAAPGPVANDRRSVAQLLRAGSAQRRAGDFTGAHATLSLARRRAPRNVDVLLQLGLTEIALKRYDAARRTLSEVLILAPEYADAKLGLARIDYFSGNFEAARARAAAAARDHPDRQDARDLVAAIDRAIAARAAASNKPPAADEALLPWRVDLDGIFSSLSQGRSNWYEGRAGASYRVRPTFSLGFSVHYANRYELSDTYIEGSFSARPYPWLSANGFIGGTPAADFLPRFVLGGGVGVRVVKKMGPLDGTVLTFDTKSSTYSDGTAYLIAPGLLQYFFRGRAWLTVKFLSTLDQQSKYLKGYLVRGDVQALPSLRLYVGYSDAPETSDRLLIPTRTIFGGATYAVSRRLELRLSLAHENREDSFDRLIVSFGATFRFR